MSDQIVTAAELEDALWDVQTFAQTMLIILLRRMDPDELASLKSMLSGWRAEGSRPRTRAYAEAMLQLLEGREPPRFQVVPGGKPDFAGPEF